MKNLEELRKRKEELRKEIAEIEKIASFKNPKESLSAFTNGFTDQFITDKTDELGEHKIGLKPMEILSFATSGVSNEYLKAKINKYGDEKIGINTQNIVGSIAENAFKLGIAGIATNYAKKNLYHSSWKKKIIGFALIYITPFILRYIREKLDDFQKKETLKSMEKII